MSTWFAAVAAVLAWGCGGADTPAETDASGDDEGSTAVDDGRPPYYSTLDRMPVDLNSAGSMLGSGWVGAEVGDGILVVEGRFEGLLSPATEAHIHRARPGLRGPRWGRWIWKRMKTARRAPFGDSYPSTLPSSRH